MSSSNYRSPATRLALAVVVTMALPLGADAQETGTVRGKVVDAEGTLPVPSAPITIVGTRLGTITDNNGQYVIRGVPAGAQTVRFARIGYSPQTKEVTVSAGADATVDFTVSKSARQLEAIVTTATGEQSRRAVGNVVAVVNTDSLLTNTGVTSATDALTARVPGVTIVQGAGTIGGSPTIVIRGQTSVGATSDPLWIVDGMRMVSGELNRSFTQNGNGTTASLNMQDIESIEVIKGPSATALYGTQANNGVVIVKTKRGQAGKTDWRVWGEVGRNDQPADWPANYRSWGRNINSATGQPVGAAVQCRPSQSAAGQCVIDSLTTFSPFTNPETTPFGDMGTRNVLGASVSGGSDKIRFYSSAERVSEVGPYTMPDGEISRLTTLLGSKPREEQIHPNAQQQTSFRGNFNAQLSSNSELTLSSAYTDRRLRTPFNGSFIQGIQIQGLLAPGYRTPFNGYAAQYLGDIMSVWQPETERRFTGDVGYTIRPLDWLSAHATIGLDRSDQSAEQFAAVGEGTNGGWGQLSGRSGGYRRALTDLNRYSVDVGTSADFALTSELTSKTSVGGQWFKDDQYEVQFSGYGLAPGTTTIPSAGTKSIDAERITQRASYGIFLDQQFSWRDRLYVSGGVRSDASNVFGPAAKRPIYPRAQASYVISDESFFPRHAGIDRLRLRVSWGQSGSAPGATQGIQVLVPNTVQYGDVILPTLMLTDGFNPAIKPELTSELEGGLDATLFGEVMNLEFTLYRKVNRDGITTIPLAPSLGTATLFPINVGRVDNHGFEYAVDVKALDRPALRWDLRVSGSHNTNKVIVLNDQPLPAPAIQRIIPGYPINGVWSRPITGFTDANGDGVLTESEVTVGADWEYIGPVQPIDQVQLTNTLGLFDHRVTLTTLFDYRGGNYHLFGSGRDRCNGGSAREANDPTAPLSEQAACIAATSASLGSTQWGYVAPADFIKLREASITFALPNQIGPVSRIPKGTIALTGRNLATLWTKYPGLDPEAGGQFNDNWIAPPLRYFLIRATLTF
jgi:TonB-linked SusC/RagA family outer membrane protein